MPTGWPAKVTQTKSARSQPFNRMRDGAHLRAAMPTLMAHEQVFSLKLAARLEQVDEQHPERV
jgi:hypothetical protein